MLTSETRQKVKKKGKILIAEMFIEVAGHSVFHKTKCGSPLVNLERFHGRAMIMTV